MKEHFHAHMHQKANGDFLLIINDVLYVLKPYVEPIPESEPEPPDTDADDSDTTSV